MSMEYGVHCDIMVDKSYHKRSRMQAYAGIPCGGVIVENMKKDEGIMSHDTNIMHIINIRRDNLQHKGPSHWE